jgi:hypothetical protein
MQIFLGNFSQKLQTLWRSVVINNDELFKSKGLISSTEYFYLMADAPRFGLYLLSVRDAAELIASDLWFEGKISINLPDAEDYDPGDPKLLKALSKYSSNYEKKLTEAVDKGSLKTTKILRNLMEELDLDKTLIDESDLISWLAERGHQTGEAFERYFEEEHEITEEVIKEIYIRRMLRKPGALPSGHLPKTHQNLERAGIDELRLEVKSLTKQYTELLGDHVLLMEKRRNTRGDNSEKKEKPLSTRSRRTLLTIIAALCKKTGVDYQHRGAAKRISIFTEEIGATVTDETVRKIIEDIEDAVETRSK